MKSLFTLTLVMLYMSMNGQMEVLQESIPVNTSKLPASMYVPSDMNDQYSKLFISKYAENSLLDGNSVRLIIEYAPPSNLPDLSNLGNLNNSDRQRLLGQYSQAMSIGSASIVNKVDKMENVSLIASTDYSPHLLVHSNMKDLEELLSYSEIITIHEDALSEKHLDNSDAIIGTDVLKAQGISGAGHSVAILDTGTDPLHAMFTNGKIVASACFNFTATFAPPNDIFNSIATCPNGMDVQVSLSDGSAGDVCDLPPNFDVDFMIDPSCGIHGNHVAGIAAGNDFFGFEGIASGSNIVALNVFSYFPNQGRLLSWSFDQMLALEFVLNYAGSYNIASANMSLGGGQFFSHCDDNPLKPIIDMLRQIGVATVISSGNDGYNDSVGSPGCISSAITVGATDDTDNLAGFSNHEASLVDLLAPGVSVASALGYQGSNGSQWLASLSGTSMAAPHVAGAFAILKSQYPDASVNQIEQALKSTGVMVNGVPRIQVNAASQALPAILNPEPIPTLGEWGLVTLGLLFSIIGLVSIQQKYRLT